MEIVIENLTKLYGQQRAVDNVSFKLKNGEVLGFLGPNGAGKTTTMRIIACFLAPTTGNVLIDGKSVFDDPESFKSKIGYLPENNPLYPDMYVTDYLKFVARIQHIPKELQSKRIAGIIDFVGLGLEKHKKIGELSKGYRQRVGLAQAMIHDPEILILDEPTTGLDPNQIVEIRELIKNLGKEKTILLSTHILQEVEATCDRIIIINQGKIATDSKPEELIHQKTGNDLVIIHVESSKVNAGQIAEKLSTISQISDVKIIDEEQKIFHLICNDSSTTRREVFRLCAENQLVLLEMKVSETRLEDIFRSLTTNN